MPKRGRIGRLTRSYPQTERVFIIHKRWLMPTSLADTWRRNGGIIRMYKNMHNVIIYVMIERWYDAV
ncbi:hypothetical protein [Neobacillus drentensis]|uniref:hypothetical protein n=1 Tax=Neobacillus drentensis TaxID=220684 RepID=UPI002FFF05C1